MATTGSRTRRQNVLEGKSSNPSSPCCSCRSVCRRRGGRRGSPPPILPAGIQRRLWDWRRGRGGSGPPEGDRPHDHILCSLKTFISICSTRGLPYSPVGLWLLCCSHTASHSRAGTGASGRPGCRTSWWPALPRSHCCRSKQ